VAAALVCLAALVLTLLLTAGDFEVTLGDRIRFGTEVLVPSAPLLLSVALFARPGDAGSRGDRLGHTGALVVGAVASVLLVLRLVADLFADGDVFGGLAERLGASLVDLGAVLLTIAVARWAGQRRSG